MSSYITVNTDVDIYLDEIDTDDLVQELNSRGHNYSVNDVDEFGMRTILSDIFQRRRTGQDYSRQLDELIYQGIGRIA